jgi:serpin B
MMKITETFLYASTFDIQALELPYKGENLSMIILLPNKQDGLTSLESSLTLETLSAIRRQLYRSKVHVTLPKFKIEYSKEMSRDFKSLGAQGVFTPGADFSGISADRNIFVSQVLHKAVVEVNEEGSEAAAVTGIVTNRMSAVFDATPEFLVNHPFFFAIVDKRNDMILFMGRVTTL